MRAETPKSMPARKRVTVAALEIMRAARAGIGTQAARLGACVWSRTTQPKQAVYSRPRIPVRNSACETSPHDPPRDSHADEDEREGPEGERGEGHGWLPSEAASTTRPRDVMALMVRHPDGDV